MRNLFCIILYFKFILFLLVGPGLQRKEGINSVNVEENLSKNSCVVKQH